eukprot:7809-Eustigmatos_ZCMA.PRE.1
MKVRSGMRKCSSVCWRRWTQCHLTAKMHDRLVLLEQNHQFSGNKNHALRFKHRSLNRDGRKKELLRITQENQ